MTTYATLIGVLFLIPFLFQQPDVTVAIYTDARAIVPLFMLGYVGSALGFLWYYEAVFAMGTVGAAIYINLVPVLVFLLPHWCSVNRSTG